MEDRDELDQSSGAGWSEQFAQTLSAQRSRVQEFVTGHRAALEQIESDLAEQLSRIMAELDHDRQVAQDSADEVHERAAEVLERGEQVRRLRQALETQQAEFAASQHEFLEKQQRLADELARRQARLDERARELSAGAEVLAERQHESASRRAEEELARQELTAGLARLVEKETQVAAQQELLAETLAATRAQRRRIAREFLDQKAAQQAFLELQRREIDITRDELAGREQTLDQRYAELEARREQLAAEGQELVAARRQLDDLAEELLAREDALVQQPPTAGAKPDARIEELQRALTEARDALKQAADQLVREREQRAVVESECEQFQGFAQALEEELHRTRQAHDELIERLGEAQSHTTAAPEAEEAAGDEYRRRYEMALEDLKEQKTRIADLEKRLAQGGGPRPSDVAMDWEAQKRRLIEALSREDEGALSATQRLSVEEAIRRTDAAVAAKNCELEELRAQLASGGLPVQVDSGDAAVAAQVNADEMVQQEREHLRQLQEEWRDKLRQAEIDLSLERAKIARERATIEEKLRTLEDETSRRGRENPGGENSGSSSKKPPRGRWLARLGLKEQDDG